MAKTTIYRHWRDKWELALDAVMIDILPRFTIPVDVGDTRKELLALVEATSPARWPCNRGTRTEIATPSTPSRSTD